MAISKSRAGKRNKSASKFWMKTVPPVIPLQYRLEYDFAGAASIVDEEDGMITLRASDNPMFVGTQIKIKAIHDASGSEAVMKVR